MEEDTHLLKLVQRPVTKLSELDLKQCYKLARNIKYYFINANEGWDVQLKLSEMRDTEDLQYLLYYEKKKVVAFASYVTNDTLDGLNHIDFTFVWEIHVHPKLRKHGLGRKLLNTIEQKALEDDNTAVVLRCFNSNTRARKFYEKMGFDESDVESGGASKYLIKRINKAITE